MDVVVFRCLKSHCRKNLAKMRLLAFEEKKNFKIEVFKEIRHFSNAWNSLSEATINNRFKKVYFTQPEDNLEEQETEDTSDREIVGIWERLHAGCLIPETHGFTQQRSRGWGGGAEGSCSPPPPFGLSTKMQNKKNNAFLALLRLFFCAGMDQKVI